jgi:uncharacterized paraquat-inducible protein A
MLIIVYLVLCFLIGIAGRHRRIGFFGFFILSLILTPVLTLLWLLATHSKFLDTELARGHVAICSECAAYQREVENVRRCVRCGAPLS